MIIIWLFCLMCNASAMIDEIRYAIKVHTINGQKEMAIVVPTYNNSRYDLCIKNLRSLLDQEYENYHIYIINDASTDDTLGKLTDFVSSHARADKVTIITNEVRCGALANYYYVISAIPDHVIVLNVDGDDWLAHNQVLAILNAVYDDEFVWLTYGQFRQYPSGEIGFCRPLAKQTVLTHNYRHSEWLATHLRTYYAWLFKKINKVDLYYEDHFIKACGDRALMYPLLEMAAGRFLCINTVLYIYNCANPLADVKINLNEQQKMCHYICSLPPYTPLDDIVICNAL